MKTDGVVLETFMPNQEIIVMSIGGSLIVPGEIATDFLTSLKNFITDQTTNHGRRFILIAGGGRTSRNYVDAASAVTELEIEDMDWLGIHATRLNAHLLRTIFREIAHPVIITNPDEVLDIPNEPNLIIGAGYRPGSSSDLQAVRIAQRVQAHKLINLSNIDYVYTADPKVDPTATKIDSISWTDFRELIPKEWSANLSSPFDPIAAKTADEHDIEVAIINGDKPDALTNYLAGKPFVGTVIS